MEKLREIFLSNVRLLAEKAELDYQDVAQKAGLSRSGIYKIMRGDREPGFDNIERIAKALNIQPARLLLAPEEKVELSPMEAWEVVGRALNSKTPPKPLLPGATAEEMDRIAAILEADPKRFKNLMELVKAFESPSADEKKPKRATRA